MKTTLMSAFALFFFTNVFSQFSNRILEYNNVNSIITDGGVFFTNEQNNTAGYRVPKTGTTTSIYSATFMFGAKDALGNTYISASRYQSGKDQFPGPYSSNNAYNAEKYTSSYGTSIWEISRLEINYHKFNYNKPNYIMPVNIANWPAHGNSEIGVAEYLAPFIDKDGDGLYNPMNGDYPDIRGDNSVYVIINDSKKVHSISNGKKLGIEIHLQFYQYSTGNPSINNTTFINSRVINRGGIDFTEFKMALFADTDLGNAADDLMGSLSSKQMVFTYNGDDYDENTQANTGFGNAPPAIGIKSLKTAMKYSGYYTGIAIINESDPKTPSDYWNALNGKFKDGTNWPSAIRFDGNPYLNTTNTELQNGNPKGDRRLFMVLDHSSFAPKQTICEDFAIMYASGSSNLQSIEELVDAADFIQSFYDDQFDFNCLDAATAQIVENTQSTAICFPTITSNKVTVQLNNASVSEITLYDNMGRFIESKTAHGNELEFSLLGLQSGVYLIKVGEQTLRVIKE